MMTIDENVVLYKLNLLREQKLNILSLSHTHTHTNVNMWGDGCIKLGGGKHAFTMHTDIKSHCTL